MTTAQQPHSTSGLLGLYNGLVGKWARETREWAINRRFWHKLDNMRRASIARHRHDCHKMSLDISSLILGPRGDRDKGQSKILPLTHCLPRFPMSRTYIAGVLSTFPFQTSQDSNWRLNGESTISSLYRVGRSLYLFSDYLARTLVIHSACLPFIQTKHNGTVSFILQTSLHALRKVHSLHQNHHGRHFPLWRYEQPNTVRSDSRHHYHLLTIT